MNAPFHPGLRPDFIRLTVDDFLLLKRAGAFSNYSKSELLYGELWGVPKQSDDEPECDSTFPIKLRVEDFERLDRAGAFSAVGKTELVDGYVYPMSPQHRPHGFAKDEFAYRLRRALEAMDSSIHVATEQSVDFGPHSEPQPDIVLTSEPRGDGPIPGASVLMIVEISSNTLSFDLGEKAQIYAEADVQEYWVVDLKGKLLHGHSGPMADGYVERKQLALGELAASVTISGLVVETTKLV